MATETSPRDVARQTKACPGCYECGKHKTALTNLCHGSGQGYRFPSLLKDCLACKGRGKIYLVKTANPSSRWKQQCVLCGGTGKVPNLTTENLWAEIANLPEPEFTRCIRKIAEPFWKTEIWLARWAVSLSEDERIDALCTALEEATTNG